MTPPVDESKTPLVDAQVEAKEANHTQMWPKVVDADFARELERAPDGEREAVAQTECIFAGMDGREEIGVHWLGDIPPVGTKLYLASPGYAQGVEAAAQVCDGYIGTVANPETLTELIRALASPPTSGAGELAAYKAAAPLCEEHKPNSGTRGGCLVCACVKLSRALSQIDYAAGEPNEQEVSLYDVFPDENAVVQRVKRILASLRQGAGLQSPESAPPGVEVLLYCPDDEPEWVVGYRSALPEFGGFAFSDACLRDIAPEGPQPTGWLPLPPAAQGAADD